MRRFWNFDVPKWSGEKKCCISVLRQNELITTPLFNSSNSDTPENHLECLNMYGCIYCVWCCLRMSWGCLRKSFVVWAVFWGWQSCLKVFCGYLRVQSIQGWVLLKPTHQFGSTLKCKENSHLIILRHQNTKTAAWKLSKNHWVRPFFAFFRFVREILFVTVAFDQPAAMQ